MIGIRPYKTSDADAILSWRQDEKAFYQWTAGVLGNFKGGKKRNKFQIYQRAKQNKNRDLREDI